jgi:hypothetical protein
MRQIALRLHEPAAVAKAALVLAADMGEQLV